jgi:hypothetical protein
VTWGHVVIFVTNKGSQMAKAKQTYADKQNARFTNTQSHFVDLVQRYQDTVNSLPPRAQANHRDRLTQAIRAFRKRYPYLKDFADRKLFRLVKATEINLMSIFIDTTMQREPDLSWIIKIIENFRDYQAQPIQVFAHQDAWGAWDSQHTALAFYLIAKFALNLDLTKVTVPANIYDITSRGDLRNLFISMNTTKGDTAGKKSLDDIDLFIQMVYGVEIDGVTTHEWVQAHKKWQHIKTAGLFVTAKKFNNTEQIGAISRLKEINEVSEELVRQFCVYGSYVTKVQQRAIETKEIPIIMKFLEMCSAEQIKYSDKDLEDLAQYCIDTFGANFHEDGRFWDQCHQATIAAWKRYNKAMNIPEEAQQQPGNKKNVPVGINFFYKQLEKGWLPTKKKGFKFPKPPEQVFALTNEDVF